MPDETQHKIDLLSDDLTAKYGNYSVALSSNAGFNKRREIRQEIREIENEIAKLKERQAKKKIRH